MKYDVYNMIPLNIVTIYEIVYRKTKITDRACLKSLLQIKIAEWNCRKDPQYAGRIG